jgi:glycosyltransferase involved in cell wall biosynthesis
VVNEAMASGLPVIVSETAGCAEDLLKPPLPATPATPPKDSFGGNTPAGVDVRQNGIVFNPNSDAALAQALLTLTAAPALREAMGKSSRIIVESFSCAAFARSALLAARAATGENVLAPRDASAAEAPLEVTRGLAS